MDDYSGSYCGLVITFYFLPLFLFSLVYYEFLCANIREFNNLFYFFKLKHLVLTC